MVYNHGNMTRDFTYIDDVIEGVFRLVPKIPEPNGQWDGKNPDPAYSFCPYRIYNIGNHNPVSLSDFITILEEKLGRKAQKEFLPIQPGDVKDTYADVEELMAAINFKPSTTVETGIENFVDWYREYYKV